MESFNLHTHHFNLGIDPKRGSVTRLSCPHDELQTNFALSPHAAPHFDIPDSRWLGDVVCTVKRLSGDGESQYLSTGLSRSNLQISREDDAVIVQYPALCSKNQCAAEIALRISYTLDEPSDEFRLEIELRNTGDTTYEIEDLGLSLTMNSLWHDTQEGIYDQNVLRHSFVAQHGSVLYWQKPSGNGQFLVAVPTGETRLEYSNKVRSGEGVLGETGAKWEGVTEFYIHSKAISALRQAYGRNNFAPSSSTLDAGASLKHGLAFKWAKGYSGMRQAIYDLGGFDVISLPGYVIPVDTNVVVALRTKQGIQSFEGNATIQHRRSANGYEIYDIRLKDIGETILNVRYGNDRQSVLRYYGIESIERLINIRANFIATKQQAVTSHGYNGAFLQWDLTSRSLLTWHDYPGGGWKEWMVGGADDLGLAPAAFLALKNQYFPIAEEIKAVDRYLEDFILGYLQNARDERGERTFQVYRWYDGQDEEPHDKGVWRAYNYTHIANTYYSMSEIALEYPSLATRLRPDEYLMYAYRTLLAMFTKIPQPTPIGDAAKELGLMGESSIPDILEALELNGHKEEYDTLNGFYEEKYRRLAQEKYPFASEQTIDTTGFETSYVLARRFGDKELARKVQAASMACRGLQPNWYHYGSDNRHMGESWWNLGYETQLGAWQQLEYLLHDNTPEDVDTSDMIRSTYGAYLGGWALVNSGQIDAHADNIGAAAWLYQSEGGRCEWDHMPISEGWWQWSGEADLGFWGGLKAAATCIVEDPIVGLYALGGTIEDRQSRYEVVPEDGLRVRVIFFALGRLCFSIKGARFTKLNLAKDVSSVDIDLEFPEGAERPALLSVTNTTSGRWRLLYDGGDASDASWEEVQDGSLVFNVNTSPTVCRIHLQSVA